MKKFPFNFRKYIILPSLFIAVVLVNINSSGKISDTSDGFSLYELAKITHANSENYFQFCMNAGQPFWGICNYTGSCEFDCFFVAVDCAFCDCDGTWIMAN